MAVSGPGFSCIIITQILASGRQEAGTTWHHVICFNPGQTNYLRTLQKGAQVYVEANFELRDPDPSADPSSVQAQRQIFLRHGILLCSCFNLCVTDPYL